MNNKLNESRFESEFSSTGKGWLCFFHRKVSRYDIFFTLNSLPSTVVVGTEDLFEPTYLTFSSKREIFENYSIGFAEPLIFSQTKNQYSSTWKSNFVRIFD